ncbi:MAG: metallophosphoesterase family protein, partial [Candidatus Babeliales bacterium]
PAQVIQTVQSSHLIPADLTWLNYISRAALVPPQPGHTGIGVMISNPHPEEIGRLFRCFAQKSLEEFSQAGVSFLGKKPDSDFPHACKWYVKPHDEIYFVGDIHGSIGALARLIWIWRNSGLLDENFKIPDGKYLVFLGDYVDYGREGTTILHTLLNLKIQNWDRMVLLRGNHENAHMTSCNGFLDELKVKYGTDTGNKLHIYYSRIFLLLPTVLYVGIDRHHKFIQCCHGGIEPGFNPRAFLESDATFYDLTPVFEQYHFDDELMAIIEPDQQKRHHLKNDLYRKMIASIILKTTSTGYRYENVMWSGFQWSDVVKQTPFAFNAARHVGFIVNEELMTALGNACNICAYIRGHQHNHGIKIGGIEHGDEKSRWYKSLGLQVQPASVTFNFFPPFTFTVNTPSTYAALLRISHLVDQHIPLTEEYTDAWQDFKTSLPSFNLLAFAPTLPIITLTTASEGARGRVDNPWDSFGLCTIGDTIENSVCALYEAEASAPQQQSSQPSLKEWLDAQRQWAQKFKLPEQKSDEEKKA